MSKLGGHLHRWASGHWRLHQEGEDPDYRFSLANERTFLAWVRTSLALLAGGIAVVQLGPALGGRHARFALGLALTVLGLVLAGRQPPPLVAQRTGDAARPHPARHCAGAGTRLQPGHGGTGSTGVTAVRGYGNGVSEVVDAGLQAERTRLAWSRTALSVAANSTLLLHSGLTTQWPAGYLPGAVVMLSAACFWVLGMRRYQVVCAALRAGRPVTEPRLVRIAGLLSVLPGLTVLFTLLAGTR